jgi:predicted nucleotidyltransferase
MPTKRSRVKEVQVPYRARRAPKKPVAEAVRVKWADIESATAPIVLERNGEKLAVVLKYDEYQRWESARLEQATVPMSAIQEIVDLIAEKFNPDKIILFGSYAYGAPRRGSDVDLLVVMETDKNVIEAAIDVRHILPLRSFGLDVLVRTPAEIERRIAVNDPFIKEIVTKGRTLYERNNSRLDSQGRE